MILSRRQVVKFGLVGGGVLSVWGFLSQIHETNEVETEVIKGYTYLDQKDRTLLSALCEVLLGIDHKSLKPEQVDQILLSVDNSIDLLSEDLQKDINNILKLFNLPFFRWYLGVFSQEWEDLSPKEITKAMENLQNSKVKLLRLAFQTVQSLVSAAYYSQEFSWADIGFPGFIQFGE